MSKALSIQNLEKVYPNQFQALKDVSFDVEKGDFFALLGPNGAGKTTLIGILTSLIHKTRGKVFILDKDIDSDFALAKTHVGLMPQEFNFSVFETPLNILINHAGYYGIPKKIARERAEKYLKTLGIWEKRNVPSRILSGGMKRRLMLARAFVHQPKLLILDEPTAGVDVETRQAMWDFLKDLNEQGITIILTTHYLEEAENLCRQIVIIDKGKVLENTSIQSLLSQLRLEVFILDLKNLYKVYPV
jgi:ABC-2 type transport system ATP-binding protein